MVAGLSVQVLSLLLFMTLSLEFGWRVWTHEDELNIKNAPLYHSLKFKGFLCCKPPLPFHIFPSLFEARLTTGGKKHSPSQRSRSSPDPSSELQSSLADSAATWLMMKSYTWFLKVR
jgi:hypothetical protein